MKRHQETGTMARAALTASLTACFCLGFAAPLLAAESPKTAAAPKTSSEAKATSNRQPAKKCLSDLRAFDGRMQKGGYWLRGSQYGLGYPMYDYVERGMLGPNGGAVGAPPSKGTVAAPHNALSQTKGGAVGAPEETHYLRARPGYEIRTLIAAANILAQHGEQRACEAVLSKTRPLYIAYAATLRKGGVARADVSGWRQQEIAAAQPVTGSTASFRSDQLVGTDVINPQGEGLGSVDDIVLRPQTGRIAYLVIGRGGVFGIGEKYVPVPWQDFKATPATKLLVLDVTKASMDAAPRVEEGQFSAKGAFGKQSAKVDDYWKAHMSSK
ncbi:MAG: PRC-barrel domain-containing protein [Salinisphaera sp.]|jgi:sporulation protein YlmC with PRC-barrel domain|nr:PRC-barrel domain-containing protein [Salinisphaera sp.]